LEENDLLNGSFSPRGVLLISSDRGDRMGAKIKTQKNPWGFKRENLKKSLRLQTKPKKIPGPKYNPKNIPCQIFKA